MTQDELIEMAKAAHRELVTEYYVGHHGQIDAWTMLLLERFAKLVAAKEREACAKVCDDINAVYSKPEDAGERVASQWCAERIRARGEA